MCRDRSVTDHREPAGWSFSGNPSYISDPDQAWDYHIMRQSVLARPHPPNWRRANYASSHRQRNAVSGETRRGTQGQRVGSVQPCERWAMIMLQITNVPMGSMVVESCKLPVAAGRPPDMAKRTASLENWVSNRDDLITAGDSAAGYSSGALGAADLGAHTAHAAHDRGRAEARRWRDDFGSYGSKRARVRHTSTSTTKNDLWAWPKSRHTPLLR